MLQGSSHSKESIADRESGLDFVLQGRLVAVLVQEPGGVGWQQERILKEL
jgi:hypothetical protein